jgi:hypothetical protein
MPGDSLVPNRIVGIPKYYFYYEQLKMHGLDCCVALVKNCGRQVEAQRGVTHPCPAPLRTYPLRPARISPSYASSLRTPTSVTSPADHPHNSTRSFSINSDGMGFMEEGGRGIDGRWRRVIVGQMGSRRLTNTPPPASLCCAVERHNETHHQLACTLRHRHLGLYMRTFTPHLHMGGRIHSFRILVQRRQR